VIAACRQKCECGGRVGHVFQSWKRVSVRVFGRCLCLGDRAESVRIRSVLWLLAVVLSVCGGSALAANASRQTAASIRAVESSCSYANVVASDSPSAYWRLGESAGATTAVDSSGSGNSGTYNGGTGLGAGGAITGDADTALNLNGATGYMEAPNSATLNSPTTSLTMEAWVKPPLASSSAFASQRPIVLKSYTSHSVPYYQYGMFLMDSSSKPKDVSVVLGVGGVYNRVDFTNTGWSYDQWSYLAATWDGNAITLYRNGVSVGTGYLSGSLPTYPTPTDIGAYANLSKNNTNLFPGQIDEVAVYNHALNPTRIQAHYAVATCTLANLTPPTLVGTAQQGSVLTADPGTWVGAPSAYAYQWQSCAGYPLAVASDSPSAYWRLGESAGATTAVDSSGSGNSGTYNGGTGLGAGGAITGDADTALNLNGATGYMEAPNSATLNSPTTSLTMEAWVKPPLASSSAFASQRPIVLKSYTSHSVPYYQYGMFLMDSSSKPKDVSVVLGVGGVYNRVDFTNTGWSYDQWSYLAATWDGNAITLYRNGVSVGTGYLSGSLPTYPTPTDIGAYANLSKNNTNLFPGQIDEVAVYNHALNPTRIQSHYTSTGGCSDISGAMASTYQVAASNIGKNVRVNVTATNATGSRTVASAPTATVQALPVPNNTSPPAVSGSLEDGGVLTADPGLWSGAPTSYSYAWLRCDTSGCSPISGATNATYSLLDDDVNSSMAVTVTATNVAGSGTATSAQTAHVRVPHYSHGDDTCSGIEDPANVLIDYPRVDYLFIPLAGSQFYDYDYTTGHTGAKAAAAIAQAHWHDSAFPATDSYYDYGTNGGCVIESAQARNVDDYVNATGHHVRFWMSAVGRRPVGAAHHDFGCGLNHSSDQWIESAEDLANFFYNFTDDNGYQPRPVWAVYQDRPYTVTDKCGEDVPDDGLTQELDFRGSQVVHVTGNGGDGLP
jgi:hypothetical protein